MELGFGVGGGEEGLNLVPLVLLEAIGQNEISCFMLMMMSCRRCACQQTSKLLLGFPRSQVRVD
jgi:hypothetical protein